MFQQKPKKKIGRFIAKGDPILNVVAVSEFTMKEIAQTTVMMADNLTGAIFHRALHNGSDEDMGILNSGAILKDFTPEGQSILQPMDFTDDWKRQRQRLSSRRSNTDDEEDFDLYGTPYAPPSEEDDAPAAAAAPAAAESDADDESKEKRGENFFKIQRDSVDQAVKALQDAQAPEPLAEEPVAEAPMRETAPPPAPPAEEKAFVPMRVNLGPEATAPEMDAVRSYQTQLVDREKIIEEAKAQGYQEGFKLGEEKAALQARRQIQELAETLAPLIAELDGLKKNILLNAQENFQTLCQALMEAVLRREFDMNPGSFASIVERAIHETVPDDSFRVHVHPELLESAARHFSEKIRGRLVPDKNLAKGDFRVESQLTVVDGNVTQMIRDLLDQADLALYQTKGKAS